MAKRIIQVEEKVPANLLIPLSIQHMFAMFGPVYEYHSYSVLTQLSYYS